MCRSEPPMDIEITDGTLELPFSDRSRIGVRSFDVQFIRRSKFDQNKKKDFYAIDVAFSSRRKLSNTCERRDLNMNTYD
jgi:hypothetical protein